MSQHNTPGGFTGSTSSQPIRVPGSGPRWEVSSTGLNPLQPKSAPAAPYMPSFGSQIQAGPFDYYGTSGTAQAHQPRQAPPVKASQDFYGRYDDPSSASYLPSSGSYGLAGTDTPWPNFSSPTRSPPKKSKSPKKADGKQATFLTKLYQVLEDPTYHNIIRWDETGELIIIERPDLLQEKILPQVYRQTRFASFSRQLNIYGWMRKVSLRHVDNGIADPDASTWSHQSLKRDSSKDDIQGYKRRVPPRPSQAQKNATRLHQDTMSLSSDSESFHSPPYTTHALGELHDGKPILEFGSGGNTSRDSMSMGYNLDSSAGDLRFGPASSQPVQRRLSMPASTTRPSLGIQPGPHRLMHHLKQHSMPVSVHGPSGLSAQLSGPNYLSQNTLQMNEAPGRQHMSHPPSASFSPSSGMGSLWIDEAARDTGDMLLRGTSSAPTFNVNDASTWARRGLGTLGDGLRPTEPPPINSSNFHSTMPFGFTPIVSNTGQSTAQGFQPVAGGQQQAQSLLATSPTKTPPPAPGSQGAQTSPSSQVSPTQTSGALPSHGQPSPRTPPSVPTGALQTVSPGVYQSGFATAPLASASGGGQGPWGSPRSSASPANMSRGTSGGATATKSERRMSVTHPYSPPRGHRQSFGSGSGSVRGVSGANRRESIQATLNTTLDHPDSEAALPSASLAQPELFSDIKNDPDLE